MNPRQAAALALVGWYLMLPPEQGGQGSFNPSAPLREWFLAGSFDTPDACQQRQTKEWARWFEAASKHERTKERDKADMMSAWYNFGKCIASDDPRLKEK